MESRLGIAAKVHGFGEHAPKLQNYETLEA